MVWTHRLDSNIDFLVSLLIPTFQWTFSFLSERVGTLMQADLEARGDTNGPELEECSSEFLFSSLYLSPSPQVVAGDTLHCGCSHAAHPYHGGHACFLYSLGFLFEAPLVSYVLQKLFSEWRGDQALALGVLFLSHTAVASMQSHVVSVQFHEGKKFYTQVKYICRLIIRGGKESNRDKNGC